MTQAPRTKRENQSLRRDVVVYGWLLAVTVGIAITLGAVAVDMAQRHSQQSQINATVSCEIDGTIDYLRTFNTTTPAQLRAEKTIVDASLTKSSEQLLKSVLDEIVTVELAAPSLTQLHPFKLPDLMCKTDPHAPGYQTHSH